MDYAVTVASVLVEKELDRDATEWADAMIERESSPEERDRLHGRVRSGFIRSSSV